MNVIGARRALLPERLPGSYLLHGFTRERERERRNPKIIDERRKIKLNKNHVLRID
jgi:hypothetical protein